MRPFDLALRFMGVSEVQGVASNPLILTMLKLDGDWPQDDEVSWCSAFCNFIAWMLRLPRSKKLNARSWLEVGYPVAPEWAVPGYDVAVFWRESPESWKGHVGWFAGFEGEDVLVLGGNQKDQVSISRYPRERLLGIRRLQA